MATTPENPQPGAPAPRPTWRAVFTKPRQEQRAHEHLQRQGYETFLPLVRVDRRLRGRDRAHVQPMFPRYLFVRLADHVHDYGPIRSTRGVAGLVRMGEQVPVVPDELIDLLRERHGEQGAIDIATLDELSRGDLVEISSGPFTGYRGLFDAKSGEKRALVLLEILSRQQKVEIPANALRRA